ncbi:MAG TPA: hypothetical protein PK509_07970, partial [Catalimonadaceae bacterium]|nr:hypothetical protein [Catalimonadaceae bacterium]
FQHNLRGKLNVQPLNCTYGLDFLTQVTSCFVGAKLLNLWNLKQKNDCQKQKKNSTQPNENNSTYRKRNSFQMGSY